jgi:uncharacterized protein YjbI with pentapeptide repeats
MTMFIIFKLNRTSFGKQNVKRLTKNNFSYNLQACVRVLRKEKVEQMAQKQTIESGQWLIKLLEGDGVSAWNLMREEKQDRIFDLSKADLRGAKLAGVNFSKVILDDAKLNRADLEDADLTEASLFGAQLVNANLTGVRLNGAYLGEANLRGARMKAVDLTDATRDCRTTMPREELLAGAIGLDRMRTRYRPVDP